jgi:serine/threonine-protein kinase
VLSDSGGGGQQVDHTVPTGGVVGKPEQEATANLQTAGFTVKSDHEKNETVAAGVVISVDPAEGTTVKSGKNEQPEATIKVSDGATTVKMPSVVGQQRDDAEKFLRDQGFTSINFTETTSDDPKVQENEVVEQNPAEGTDVAKTAVITLTVSTGKPKVAIQDVSGKSAAEAANILGQQGLVTKTSTESSDSVPKDKVIRTDPAAGTQVDKGSNVTIVVSSGKAQATVPSVTGLTKAAAESTINNAGLVPKAHCHINGGSPAEGDVTSQDPAPNAKVDQGSTVNFDVDTSDPTICA